jgi:hypothetical protein
MITFLPFANYTETAACLDRQRLGKQRVETLQVARCLAGVPSSWKNHPTVQMWRGYEWALLKYQEALCHEWSAIRGYNDTCLQNTTELLFPQRGRGREVGLVVADPWWLGVEEFHLSHQSNLLRKDVKHYGRFFVGVPDKLPYLWPTTEPNTWG